MSLYGNGLIGLHSGETMPAEELQVPPVTVSVKAVPSGIPTIVMFPAARVEGLSPLTEPAFGVSVYVALPPPS